MEIVALMANHLNETKNSDPAALAERVTALELLLQQLVFVLECQGALNAHALDRWLTTCRAAMLRTGSVPPSTVVALTRLQRQVRQ